MTTHAFADRWNRNLVIAFGAIAVGLWGHFMFPAPFVVFSSMPYDEVRSGADPAEYLRLGLGGGPLVLTLLGWQPHWSAPVGYLQRDVLALTGIVAPVVLASLAVGVLGLIAALVANVVDGAQGLLYRDHVIRVAGWGVGGVAGLSVALMVLLQVLLTIQFAKWVAIGVVATAVIGLVAAIVIGSVGDGRR